MSIIDTTSKEKSLHWADEKEITSSRPLAVMLFFIKILPVWLSMAITHIVAFIFYIFSRRARVECRRYQRQMLVYNPRFRIDILRQIISFSLSLTEKVVSWIGRMTLRQVEFCGEDIMRLREDLERGEGAVVICSHQGNSEMLRSLADWGRTGLDRDIPVITIMDMNSTANFNRMLGIANSRFGANIVNPDNVTPATIERLQDCIDHGGLVVIAGDRTANKNRTRIFRHIFLGKEAPFAFGAYYMATLLDAPVYFQFALRDSDIGVRIRYKMYMHRYDLRPLEGRRARIKAAEALSLEFCRKLEGYAVEYPYQWYNFYDFWAFPEDSISHGGSADNVGGNSISHGGSADNGGDI